MQQLDYQVPRGLFIEFILHCEKLWKLVNHSAYVRGPLTGDHHALSDPPIMLLLYSLPMILTSIGIFSKLMHIRVN